MFNTVIENATAAQKQAITTFVKNEDIAKAFTGMLDTQAALTKQVVKASTDAFTTVGQEVVKATQVVAKELGKTDFVKEFSKFAKVPAKA